ncbi:MAG TPA: hypothetical protein ENN67_07485, partial [Firmicutes bacterium]|nr:hypothetical protein [Bacillota bacterium]
MSKKMKIYITTASILAVIAIVLLGSFSFWTRPGRMSESSARELAMDAWHSASYGLPSGAIIPHLNLAGRRFVGKPADSAALMLKYHPIATAGRSIRYKPDEEFFSHVNISHLGRVWTAGRWCERIRLAPSTYSGHSLELWIDPDKKIPLGWRKFNENGDFVRGYRYLRVNGRDNGGEVIPAETHGMDFMFESGVFGKIPDNKLDELFESGIIVKPSWLPDGFRLIAVRDFDIPDRRPMQFRGMGHGSFSPLFSKRFQLIYSDGLNTVSIFEFPHGLPEGVPKDRPRLTEIIESKNREFQRIFNTSVTFQMYETGFAMIFGEISVDVLKRIG